MIGPAGSVRYLSLAEILDLHGRVIAQSGGAHGVRDLGLLESAVAQPRGALGSEELYPDLAAKAAPLGHALISNHPFLDGNKRVGHAAREVFVLLNGAELTADIDEAERVILDVAGGKYSREQLAEWVRRRLQSA